MSEEQKSFRRAGVIGWPIEHSKSPILHNYWLEKYGIEGSYEKIAVQPDMLADGFQHLIKKGYAGWNLTIPHKEVAVPLMDSLDPAAERIGAVNTVVVDEDGKLKGYNTDGYGFLKNLQNSVPEWEPKNCTALVLGAGGAARAAVDSLAQSGVPQIYIMARNLKKAAQLAEDFTTEKSRISVYEWGENPALFETVTLLVNATPLGMEGNEDEPDLTIIRHLPKDTAVVYDLVYTPLETDLLERAKKRGLKTVTGIGMLAYQAVPGFSYWFGQRPEVTEELLNLLT
ncbi:MAG: shikimate dehydrogenase [Pseudomonadota bacterium]|jgi:shikimate dehydrogenase|nr:shikimate dehydrogenase [Pseudomonadota bacterium]QKK04444.1 MAG: shikimate dehydrogenase [Pseudomonadota bacterium]